MTDTLDQAPTPAPAPLLTCLSCRWPHIHTGTTEQLADATEAWWCGNCSPTRPREESPVSTGRADAASRAIPFPRRLIALLRRPT